jgi:hypothetical protein
MTEGESKPPRVLSDGVFWFSRTLLKADLTNEEFTEWCTTMEAVADELIQATKRRGTYPPPKFAKPIREYTEQEKHTIAAAVSHACAESATTVRGQDVERLRMP